jgi:glycosyltransferase involved in cell wall biosynthesis
VLVTSRGRRTEVEDREGVRVIRAGRFGEAASTPLSVELIREIGRSDADILHLHVPYPVGELGYLLAGHARPLVVTYHSDVVRQRWARPIYEPVLRRLLRRASAIIATSPSYARSSRLLAPLGDRCEIVPLGVDARRFRPEVPGAKAVRAEWCTSPFPYLVLFVGRFRTYKGLSHLIDAMPGLPARLLLIGDGPSAPDLRAQIRQNGTDDQIAILSDVDDASLPAYYAACDLFALPSIQRSEAFGLALLEAMAAGRPVVSTELGTGTSWVNQNGVTGLVVPPADTAALAGALRTILLDDVVRVRMGEEARRRVEAAFTEGAMLARIEGIYRRVLANKGNG